MVSIEQMQCGISVQPKSKRRSKKKKKRASKNSQSKTLATVERKGSREKSIANFEQSEDSTLDGDSISPRLDEPGFSKFFNKRGFVNMLHIDVKI